MSQCSYRYSCDVCAKTYNHKSSLERHKRRHTGEKPYKCTKCDKMFASWDIWNYHKEKCESAQLFECDYLATNDEKCDYSTPIKRHLISHKQQKHDKMFMHCSLCGYKSKCPLAMEKHRIDRHLIKCEHERLRTLNLSSISVSDACRVNTFMEVNQRSCSSSISYEHSNSVVSSIDDESSSIFTDSSSIFSKDRFSKASCDTMEVDEDRSQCSSPLIDVTGPYGPFSQVTSFRVGVITDHSIQLKWRRPIDVGDEIIQSYHLQFSKYTSPSLVPENSWIDLTESPSNNLEITINGLVYNSSYHFRISATMISGRTNWVAIGPFTCVAEIDRPQIKLPRMLTKPIRIRVGRKLHLKIPFEAGPKATVKWRKQDEMAEEMELESHVKIHTVKDATIMFISNCQLWDTGRYKIILRDDQLESIANVFVVITDLSSKPRNLKITDITGSTAEVSWSEPQSTGNCEIIGYQVEKKDRRSDEWFVVYDKVRHCQCSCGGLVVGNDYQFRIRTINEVGLGEGAISTEFAEIPKQTMFYEKPVWPQMHDPDSPMKPEFTTPLNGRTLVIGYNGTLTCAIRGRPRPRIKWFKNQIEIINDPKFKISWGQGIIQLEIRRAHRTDAGTYTCLASNEHGEAAVTADVFVRDPTVSNTLLQK